MMLSAKLVTSLAGAIASFFAIPALGMIESAPAWFTEYGALGMICGFLIYAIKVMHAINQNLQKDWREDKKQAEEARLQDRDVFYGKLEKHFDEALESRRELVESSKRQSQAIDELTRCIKNTPTCKHQ